MKAFFETFLYVLIRGLVRVLTESWSFDFVERVVWLAHNRFGWRKKETIRRMAQVFPERSPDAREAMRKEALFNLGRSFTELLRMPPDFENRIEGKEATFEAFRKARERGKGVLLVIVHSGNWDLAGVATSRAGFPMCFIARKQKNNRIYEDMVQAREEGGGEVLDRDDPRLIRKVLSFLATNGIVAILIDIRARKPGEAWSYLGHDAWVSNGLGLLAAKSEASIVPVYLGRNGRTSHIWKPFSERWLPPSSTRAEREELLQSCFDDLGQEVLQNPESYFWFNKRWVLQAPDA